MFADKWFSPRMGTDVAFALAIAYTWLTEGTYDKEYVASRTTGFDQWRAYVLGESDGKPKTPEWAGGRVRPRRPGYPGAGPRMGVEEDRCSRRAAITAWAAPAAASWGNEWSRAMIALAAMQGMGKPGSNIWATTTGGPVDCSFLFPGYAEGGISGDVDNSGAGFRWVYRLFPQRRRHPLHPSLHRGPDSAAAADPGGHPAGAPRMEGQRLLRLLHRVAVPEVRVSGARLSPHRDVLPLRRLLLRHHDRDQPVRQEPTRPRSCHSW